MFRMIMALLAIIFGIKLLNDDNNNDTGTYNIYFNNDNNETDDCDPDFDDDIVDTMAYDDEFWL